MHRRVQIGPHTYCLVSAVALVAVTLPLDQLPVPVLERFSCERMVTLVDRAVVRASEPTAGSVRMSAAFIPTHTDASMRRVRASVAEIRELYDDGTLPRIAQAFVSLGSVDRRCPGWARHVGN